MKHILCAITLMILTITLQASGAWAACSSPAGKAGDIIYNETEHVFQYCNDTDWVGMNKPGSGSGGCTNPTVLEGQMSYNVDHRVLQGCAGNVHVAMGPVGGIGEWKSISVGFAHTCGIQLDDRLLCWGQNQNGATGQNTFTGLVIIPTEISGGGLWKSVSAGMSHTCAIKSDDTLWCWGNNGFGQIGDNTTTGVAIPTAVSGGGTWKQVSVTHFHSCAIKTDDSVWCWGTNTNGQLGDGTSGTFRQVPTAVSGGGLWKHVEAGQNYSCGIKSDDTVHCWGANTYGATGQNTAAGNTLTPAAISGGGTWKSVSTFFRHTCGIKSDDTAWCWGYNSDGQIGDNTIINKLVPTAITGGGAWKMIYASYSTTCGIKTDNSAHCWGSNSNGVTGQASTSGNTLTPSAVLGGGSWKDISPGGSTACSIKTDGSLHCRGANTYGAVGNNMSTIQAVAVKISDNSDWKTSSSGAYHSCAIKSDDTLWCWGLNGNGQIGDGTSGTNRLTPTQVSGGGTWKFVSAGINHTCGIKSDDTLYCWGLNTNGWLGDGTTGTNRLVPTQVAGGGSWKDVSAGNFHTCGVKTDNSLYCWGSNTSGQLGDNSTTQRNSPTPVSGGGSWEMVSAAFGNGFSHHSCGIKSDRTIWCWGSNGNGRTGLNTGAGNTLVPAQISGGGTWKALSVASFHVCAIKSDDTLHCWGSNNYGASGQNVAFGDTLVPTEVFGGGQWKQVSARGFGSFSMSYDSTCAVKSDNTLYCWGENTNGKTALNLTSGNTVIPTQIQGGGSWKQAAVGASHACAIAQDNKIYCWGWNTSGQLTTTQYSSPFQSSNTQPWCGSPTGKPGAIAYNSASNILQYCDGNGWVGIVGTGP